MIYPPRPESISGGCLCGAIRFTIKFPNEQDWPPQANGICHCTMCKKHSGSLSPQWAEFPTANIHPSITSTSHASFKTYASSSNVVRGFCNICGSSLTFQDTSDTDVVYIAVGVLDEDVLCGKRDEENAWEDEVGRHVPRIGGWGEVLGQPRYHIFCENEIKGVTDGGFEGDKWLRCKSMAKGFRGKAAKLKRKG